MPLHRVLQWCLLDKLLYGLRELDHHEVNSATHAKPTPYPPSSHTDIIGVIRLGSNMDKLVIRGDHAIHARVRLEADSQDFLVYPH